MQAHIFLVQNLFHLAQRHKKTRVPFTSIFIKNIFFCVLVNTSRTTHFSDILMINWRTCKILEMFLGLAEFHSGCLTNFAKKTKLMRFCLRPSI